MEAPASNATCLRFPVTGTFNLQATLVDSGQAFGWEMFGGRAGGVVGAHPCLLRVTEGAVEAVVPAGTDPAALSAFLRAEEDLEAIMAGFPPEDPHLRAAAAFCPGLRLVRQEPWECLASFLVSPLKQIPQIRQVLRSLRTDLGDPVMLEGIRFHTFPSAARIAAVGEEALRAHKMGFRAANLLRAARQVAEGEVDLEAVRALDYDAAVEELCRLHGVGRKIADCVLLFAYGHPRAFPVDVWIERVLRRLYFAGRRRVTRERLLRFCASGFGPHPGYAQQYLFHYVRHHRSVLD